MWTWLRHLRERRLFEYQFHRPSDALRAFPTAWSEGAAADDDEPLIDRIIAAYRRSPSVAAPPDDSMWSSVFHDCHREIHAALLDGARDRVAPILRNPAASDLFFGFESLSRSLVDGHRLAERSAPALALNGLVAFAEAMGLRRLENPETYPAAPPPRIDPDALLEEIDAALGVALPIPNPFPREFGARTRRGVMSYRVPQAMYQAWCLRELARGTVEPRILEVGAGLGRTALYAQTLGLADYTIVDLPITAVAQGYFLGRTLGQDRVTLEGEPHRRGAVRLQSPAAFFPDDRRYHIVLNADSLTEMGQAAARQYWDAFTRRADRVLSINHEANPLTVRDLSAAGPVPARISRWRSWTRRGYVEELVEFDAR